MCKNLGLVGLHSAPAAAVQGQRKEEEGGMREEWQWYYEGKGMRREGVRDER